MSQEIRCLARLDIPERLQDVIQQLAAINSDYAELLEKLYKNRVPFIKEIAAKVIEKMIEEKGLSLSRKINGQGRIDPRAGETLGVLTGNGISYGVAITLDQEGSLGFFAYDRENFDNVRKFKDDFRNMFYQEMIKTILFVFEFQMEEENVTSTSEGVRDVSMVMVKNPIGGGD